MSKKHLIYFDGDCALCNGAVRHIQKIDKNHIFDFEPLPPRYLELNSIVLLENHSRVWIRSRAIFRIYYLIGGKWLLLGLLCFLPGFIGDAVYKFVARHRHRFH